MSAITHAHACSQTHGLTIIYHQFQSMSAIGTSMAACFSDLISAWSPLLPYARLLASSETSNCGALRLEAGRPIFQGYGEPCAALEWQPEGSAGCKEPCQKDGLGGQEITRLICAGNVTMF